MQIVRGIWQLTFKNVKIEKLLLSENLTFNTEEIKIKINPNKETCTHFVACMHQEFFTTGYAIIQ